MKSLKMFSCRFASVSNSQMKLDFTPPQPSEISGQQHKLAQGLQIHRFVCVCLCGGLQQQSEAPQGV